MISSRDGSSPATTPLPITSGARDGVRSQFPAGEALETAILERGWEIGLRRNLVWVATPERFFFAGIKGRHHHLALAEAYRQALAWGDEACG